MPTFLSADSGLGCPSRHSVSSTYPMPTSAIQFLLNTLAWISPLVPTFGWKVLDSSLGWGGRKVFARWELHTEQTSGTGILLRALNGDLKVGKDLLSGEDLTTTR